VDSVVDVKIGDIFESKADVLVNTVNCVGIMGKGLASQFRERFPDMFQDYAGRCAKGEVRLGRPYLYRTLLGPWILNFPTKEHWRSVSNLADITDGLRYVVDHYRDLGIKSIAFPPLGCGQGQLDWRVVGPVLYSHLARMDIPVELYAPIGTPANQMTESYLQPTLSDHKTGAESHPAKPIDPAWIALVEILSRVLEHRYHWPVGRTMFQKMVYVATKEGLPTKAEFVKGSYGPFSPQVKGMLARLVANGLVTERQEGRMFSLETGQSFPQARHTYASEMHQWNRIIGKAADLFKRVDTEMAEIVSTILFSSSEFEQRKLTPTDAMIVDAVLEWKQRRRPPLDRSSIIGTVHDLAALGWLEFTPTTEAAPDEV
jgi:uncharacterized protein YwgA/O-acetyl-ADP-ribose deacetylase (regulator of RNase III)